MKSAIIVTLTLFSSLVVAQEVEESSALSTTSPFSTPVAFMSEVTQVLPTDSFSGTLEDGTPCNGTLQIDAATGRLDAVVTAHFSSGVAKVEVHWSALDLPMKPAVLSDRGQRASYSAVRVIKSGRREDKYINIVSVEFQSRHSKSETPDQPPIESKLSSLYLFNEQTAGLNISNLYCLRKATP